MKSRPRALTIAGSDSGGGAGIQADLKTFAAHGVFGMSAVTAVTAQNTVEVTAVEAVSSHLVAAQIAAVFEDLGVDAVKVGMLGSAEIVVTVAAALGRYAGPPVVVDPVMVAKSGARLLEPEALAPLLDDLVPLARLITPNLPEARLLLAPSGDTAVDALSPEELGRRLIETLAAKLDPCPAVLLKGGHDDAPGEVVDRLYEVSGGAVTNRSFAHPRIETRATHGTGCTLSAAIAARLAGGRELSESISGAIDYLDGALRHASPLGSGHGPVDHLFALEGDAR